MSKVFTTFDSQTGEIKGIIICPEDLIELQVQNNNNFYIEGNADSITQYVNPDTLLITDKTEIQVSINKTNIIADGVDTIIISNLPASSIITVTEIGSYTINDGTDVFEFSIDSPGEYTIICSAFPYLDKEFIINAS